MEIRVREHSRHVVILTIDNQARLNAMSRQMMTDLARLWDELERGSCRCIVLTGAGERAFSAGADMSGDLSAAPETAQVVGHALLKHHVFSKPIVAAVNGDCVGGGVELLLSTDVRAAAPHARFGLPEVRWSIYPFGGATIKLVRQIGYVHAMDLLLTGRLVDAVEAARLGLVNRVVPAEGLMTWALETAEAIAANSPAAVQAVKRQISATAGEHALSREALEQELGDRVRASADFKEGVAAFREKRRPRYE
ncbi:MAG TPA: enoyl-CoA hydratase-related protein [Candidatus Binatia bacterium]|nr:enoyl-CoA hydratase-related protein [Candidatus Binatia bacterium]